MADTSPAVRLSLTTASQLDDLDPDVLRAVYIDGEPVVVPVPEEVADG